MELIKMKNDKIDFLMRVKNVKYSKLAKVMDRSRQSVSQTKIKGCWTGSNLISIAEATNTKLCYVDKDTDKIIIELDNTDI